MTSSEIRKKCVCVTCAICTGFTVNISSQKQCTIREMQYLSVNKTSDFHHQNLLALIYFFLVVVEGVNI